MGGSVTLRIFLRSNWLLDLPDLIIFFYVLWTFSMGKNNFLPKYLFLLKNYFQTMLFLFFFRTLWVGSVGFEKSGKFRTFFFFETYPNPSELMPFSLSLRYGFRSGSEDVEANGVKVVLTEFQMSRWTIILFVIIWIY